MNTEVNARIFGSNADAAISEIHLVLVQLENLLSRYLPDSEINKINQYAGKTEVPLSLATLEILAFAVELSQISDGLFDITVGPLIDLWNFKKSECVPDARLIQKMLELVDYKDIRLNSLRKAAGIRRPGQSIDLGGIAKGYASDRVIQKVQQLGINSAYINIGGNVSTLGKKPDGNTWRVGIRHPRYDSNLLGAVEVNSKAVVTSGDYERYFIDKNGKRWHHILNPKNGYPAEAGLISVTVIADNAMTADGLSTTLFVAGLENGLRYLAQFPNVEAVFVDDDSHIFITQGLKGCFRTADGISYSIL
jgi:thiamine biosynthesis lipoprotein